MGAPNFEVGNGQSPADYAVAVTPNDSTDLARTPRAVYVGGAGNLNVDMSDGTTILFANLTAGTILPVRVKRVRATSTTATSLVALY